MDHPPWLAALSFALIAAAPLAGACSIDENYLDPDEPWHRADHATEEPALDDTLRVVSYNLAFGRELEVAITALQTGPLAGADLVLMQEMDAPGVDAIAVALELRYIYYPASKKEGRDWGNAVLSRWPLVDHHKVLLPHADPYTDSRRIAVAAVVAVGDLELPVYSTHTATPSLGLGARLDQIEAILDDAGDARPAIVGGDLNTADPGSAGQVLQLFAERGFEWASDGATDTGTAFGLYDVTLDYILARGLAAGESDTFEGENGSDHKPIWVNLRIGPP